jgi:hypothetical protein
MKVTITFDTKTWADKYPKKTLEDIFASFAVILLRTVLVRPGDPMVLMDGDKNEVATAKIEWED